MNLEDKIDIVKNILRGKKVAVGFSGGADSTLLVYLSSKVAKNTLAITINNHMFPNGFIEDTKKSAKSFGINHEIIDIDFYENGDFLANDSSRCYDCRNLMYEEIEKLALEKGFDFICDGNNISDLVVDRPGILITYKKNFKTPFIEAKLTSKEIHEYLNRNNIPYSKSTTCLLTRFPTNTRATKEKIEQINYCENYILNNTDCQIVKVRNLGDIAVIEVDKTNELLNNFNEIEEELKDKGFKKVTLNLSEIDDDEYISIDFNDNSFTYQLPFTINLENTKEQLKNESIDESKDKIELENLVIFENGLIKGENLESYEIALNEFMEILPRLRRNI
ncbi:MAG: ATP-dependent sacrificial sulfur transferase LarE [Methanobrevibacter sp.]|nr:ATP-dependent sacrificial sulfur transferase LarE [Methanobrevibacter sp.]